MTAFTKVCNPYRLVLHCNATNRERDWGYKFTVGIIRKDSPAPPPLKYFSVSSHLQLLITKAFDAALRDQSRDLLRPALSVLKPLLQLAELKRDSQAVSSTATLQKVFESSHPYRDNMSEYTVISIPGARKLSISFDPQTATEGNYDYLRLFKDDLHVEFWGEEKYSGGRGGSDHNWPGLKGRPPLIIPASSFVLYFCTDSSNNDWGYKFTVLAEVEQSAGSSHTQADAARCLLQYLGEGPRLPADSGARWEFLAPHTVEHSSVHVCEDFVLDSKLCELHNDFVSAPTAYQNLAKTSFTVNAELNDGSCTVYAEPSSLSARLATVNTASGELQAVGAQGEFVQIAIPCDANEEIKFGWVRRRTDDKIFLSSKDSVPLSGDTAIVDVNITTGKDAAKTGISTQSMYVFNPVP